MNNGISFQGTINLTKFEQGCKKASKYITTEEQDKVIRDTASRIFKYYNPSSFKILKEEQDKPFRQLISEIIGEDITKKNYLETSIGSYSQRNIVVKDMNRRTHDGIELDIRI